MRHRKSGRPLGRTSAHRKAMYRNMVTSLLEHERITTTEAKAKELRRFAERTITRGLSIQEALAKPEAERTAAEKASIVHAYRMAGRLVRSREVLEKLFSTIAPRYKERAGGYTRIVKTAPRAGDAARMAIIELVGE
ncbi:50S ribosomal protein L17 [Paraliomyxa miuraensis]|uniref:50S ribosomal protein L17 n=1 Tax=Paraliomyxa miuraensis TaxID=376150 RepID=UPI0022517470|nr:50S ribosomal protein L17 [Paraliomyxa miuraensis]MCX4241303.1 50S ribosomal protein L17 [Paraliomyxa miuraensis]